MPPLTPVVKYLIVLNFLVFAIVYLPLYLGYNFNIASELMLYYPGGDSFRPYQLVSHFFMHDGSSIMHIAFNMLSLYFLGPIVETRIGSGRFLALYLLAALGAAALHIGHTWYEIQTYQDLAAAFNADPSLANLNLFFKHVPTEQLQENGKMVSQMVGELQNQIALNKATPEVIGESYYLMNQFVDFMKNGQPVLGASGAVSGIAAAFAVFFPWQKLQIIFIPIGIYAAYLIPGFFLIDLVLGILNLNFDNIAHFAHIGGAIAGAVIAYYWSKTTLPPWLKRGDGPA